MKTLVIRDGKFLRDGKVEPIKIGDADQIKVLKEQVAYIEQISDEGIILDELLTIHDLEDEDELGELEELVLKFECVCGCSIEKSYDVHYQSNLYLFNKKKYKCSRCNKKYTITEDEDSFFLVVKLIK